LIAHAEGTGVTRREVLDAIYPAFASGGAGKNEILAAAAGAEPRSEITAMLGRLPARRYPSVRDVWSDLPEMPIS
jgi:hypothetical protein